MHVTYDPDTGKIKSVHLEVWDYGFAGAKKPDDAGEAVKKELEGIDLRRRGQEIQRKLGEKMHNLVLEGWINGASVLLAFPG